MTMSFGKKAIFYILLILSAVILFAPTIMAIVMSFMTNQDILTGSFPTTLTLLFNSALNTIVDSYNESQDNVQVNAEYQGSYDEALTKFNAVAGSDSAPMMIQTFEIGTMSMINIGQIEPIQDFIGADDYDMGGLEVNIINYYSLDGEFYSMPFNSSTPVMYYNKDAFEAAGLDPEAPPETCEEVEEANKA